MAPSNSPQALRPRLGHHLMFLSTGPSTWPKAHVPRCFALYLFIGCFRPAADHDLGHPQRPAVVQLYRRYLIWRG
jgi:hypothetical protein